MEKQVTACFRVPEADYQEFKIWLLREKMQVQDALLLAFQGFAREKNIPQRSGGGSSK